MALKIKTIFFILFFFILFFYLFIDLFIFVIENSQFCLKNKKNNICIPHSLFSKKKIAQHLAFWPKDSETNLFFLGLNQTYFNYFIVTQQGVSRLLF